NAVEKGILNRKATKFATVFAVALNGQGQTLQITRIKGDDLNSILCDHDSIRMPKATEIRRVQPRLDGEHHPRLDDGIVANVEEGSFVAAQANRVTDVMPPILHQVVIFVVFA